MRASIDASRSGFRAETGLAVPLFALTLARLRLLGQIGFGN